MAKTGILYVVGTPIGNLEDMTFRAVRVLQEVDLIAAEDTRHTGKLLQHFQITTPQISYHDFNQKKRLGELLNRLERGEKIALVTDAGMPGIADPGFELVQACGEAGLKVIPIPGVSAGVTALAVSGLETGRFVFEGFLPTKGKERRDRLQLLTQETRTIILYEAPHHLRTTLTDLGAFFSLERLIVLARELTKIYEEVWRGTIGEAIDLYQKQEPKGEFTLVIAGAKINPVEVLSEAELQEELQGLLREGMTRSQASRHLAQLTSLPRRQLYQIALSLPET